MNLQTLVCQNALYFLNISTFTHTYWASEHRVVAEIDDLVDSFTPLQNFLPISSDSLQCSQLICFSRIPCSVFPFSWHYSLLFHRFVLLFYKVECWFAKDRRQSIVFCCVFLTLHSTHNYINLGIYFYCIFFLLWQPIRCTFEHSHCWPLVYF